MSYENDLEKRIEELENKLQVANRPKFIVLGYYTDEKFWIVKGFYGLSNAQKFIDRLVLDFKGSKVFLDEISDDELSNNETYEENKILLDKFHNKYGHSVFAGEEILLNGELPQYRVERLEFELID